MFVVRYERKRRAQKVIGRRRKSDIHVARLTPAFVVCLSVPDREEYECR